MRALHDSETQGEQANPQGQPIKRPAGQNEIISAQRDHEARLLGARDDVLHRSLLEIQFFNLLSMQFP
jgi:hypothetical protein